MPGKCSVTQRNYLFSPDLTFLAYFPWGSVFRKEAAPSVMHPSLSVENRKRSIMSQENRHRIPINVRGQTEWL